MWDVTYNFRSETWEKGEGRGEKGEGRRERFPPVQTAGP
jgi:hypothetical protein